MKAWKAWKKPLLLALALGIGFGPAAINAQAKEAYTYTVTFYAGNQGTFTSQEGLSIRDGVGQVQVEGDKITISGLPAGAVVSFNPQAGAISLGDNGKYYIRGVRGSGRDNNAVSSSAFKVSGDADYVAAYGIKGNQVKYTVYYQDQSGNQIAEPEYYYGNIGDKPVVAYKYINADWTPQILALTGTLSANEADNVFVFVYEPTAAAATPAPTPTPAEPAPAPTPTPATPAPATTTPAPTTTTPAPTPTVPTAPMEPTEPTPVTQPEPGEPGDIITDTDPDVPTTNPDVGEVENVPDDQVPQGNTKLTTKVEKGFPVLMYGGIGILSAAMVVAATLLARKRLMPKMGKKGANADGGADKKDGR